MLPDEEHSKAKTCVDKAFEIWEDTKGEKSAQLIFCDLSTPKGDGTFNVYEDIRNKLMEKGVPVVLVSRCFNGIAEPVYAYEGGGVKLQEAGVMFVKELNAPKARLKLLIALSAGLKGQELKNYIEG